jgi:hypothetical protein
MSYKKFVINYASATYIQVGLFRLHMTNDIMKIDDNLSQSKTIRPADFFLTKPYLETKKDVDEFLSKLQNELENAVNKNKRVKIQ